MILQIPNNVVPALQAKGFDIDKILKKLNTDITNSANKENQKNDWIYRDISEITGLEKYLTDKYAPPEKIWHSKTETRDWAEEKYLAIKENYLSQRTKIDKNEKERAMRLESWFKYLETEPDIKNNTFAKLILAEHITQNAMAKSSQLPPKFDKNLAENLISDILKNDAYDNNKHKDVSHSAKTTHQTKNDKNNNNPDKAKLAQTGKTPTENQELTESRAHEKMHKKKLNYDV